MSDGGFTAPVRTLCGVLAVALLAPLYVDGSACAQEVAEQFKCAACHVDRIRELKRPRGPTLIDPETIWQGVHGRQEAASTQRMCLSCHDGFVEDARYVWSEGHATHPVGVRLPASISMKIIGDEAAFPLNEDDEIYCGTCHSGHLGEGAAATAPLFLRVDSENGNICTSCHADKAEIAGSPHATVRRRRQPPDFDSRGICGNCHAPHDNQGPLLWARPPGEGNVPAATLCGSCHQGEPSPASHPDRVLAWSQATRELLGANPVVEMPVFDDDVRHADRGRIACPTCHNPHKHRAEGLAQEVPGLFLRLATTEGMLCADCHRAEALFRYKFFHSRKSRYR